MADREPQPRPRKRIKRPGKPEDNGAGDVERLKAELEMESSTWAAIDLAPILAGKQTADPPSILAREDETCLLYRGKLHSLYGEPEAGKGWVALKAAAEQLAAGERVLYIDFEDDAETAVERLRALGATPNAIQSRFKYLRPDEPLSEAGRADLEAALDPAPSLVVLDGMTEALALEGLDLNNNSEVAQWIVGLPRRIAVETAAAVLTIDHVIKDGDSGGRFAIGAQHKLAGVHAAYSIKAVKPFGRGLDGSSRIKVEKDRPGHVRRHADNKVIAEMKFTSDSEGDVTIDLEPPNPEKWLPAERMEAISVWLESQSEPMSRTKLLQLVGGREAILDAAIRALGEGGYIKIDPGGKGKTTYHSHLQPYRAPTEDGK